jgi:hypothetical protein
VFFFLGVLTPRQSTAKCLNYEFSALPFVSLIHQKHGRRRQSTAAHTKIFQGERLIKISVLSNSQLTLILFVPQTFNHEKGHGRIVECISGFLKDGTDTHPTLIMSLHLLIDTKTLISRLNPIICFRDCIMVGRRSFFSFPSLNF